MKQDICVGLVENQTTLIVSIVLRCTMAENTTTSIAYIHLATQGTFVKKKLVCKITLNNCKVNC